MKKGIILLLVTVLLFASCTQSSVQTKSNVNQEAEREALKKAADEYLKEQAAVDSKTQINTNTVEIDNGIEIDDSNLVEAEEVAHSNTPTKTISGDLSITELKIKIPDGFSFGDDVEARVKLKNTGFSVNDTVDVYVESRTYTGELVGSCTMRYRLKDTSGTCTIKDIHTKREQNFEAVVDPNNKFKETNEKNNIRDERVEFVDN